jgi:hypothetical protein
VKPTGFKLSPRDRNYLDMVESMAHIDAAMERIGHIPKSPTTIALSGHLANAEVMLERARRYCEERLEYLKGGGTE